MKIGIVGTPGGWSSEWLADEAATRTGERLLIEINRTALDLDHNRLLYQGINLGGLDAVIVKKIGSRYAPDLLDRLELLRFLSARGVAVFSEPAAIIRVLDRLSCTITLRLAGIPMPPTVITEDPGLALAAVRRYRTAVFKPLFSTKARGMTIIADTPSAPEEIDAYRASHRVMYIQQKIELGGRDLGLVFLGGQYLTTYARCQEQGAWNTTTASGGRYQPAKPSPFLIELARRAQEPFGLDFTCVDIAETPEGPMVFEVSAFGGFRGIKETSDLNPAALYIDYVLNKIKA